MIFSREYIGYLGRRTVKHLIDAKMITSSNLKVTEERGTSGLTEELSLEDRINEEVRVILDAYSEEMRKSGAQYAEMFKKVKTELAKKYKAVLLGSAPTSLTSWPIPWLPPCPTSTRLAFSTIPTPSAITPARL